MSLRPLTLVPILQSSDLTMPAMHATWQVLPGSFYLVVRNGEELRERGAAGE